MGKFEKCRPMPPFPNLYQFISKCHLLSWKIILMQFLCGRDFAFAFDSCSANLTFRAHNDINKIKQSYVK